MKGVVSTSETSVNFDKTTQSNVTEDSHLRVHTLFLSSLSPNKWGQSSNTKVPRALVCCTERALRSAVSTSRLSGSKFLSRTAGAAESTYALLGQQTTVFQNLFIQTRNMYAICLRRSVWLHTRTFHLVRICWVLHSLYFKYFSALFDMNI